MIQKVHDINDLGCGFLRSKAMIEKEEQQARETAKQEQELDEYIEQQQMLVSKKPRLGY
jgi:hypothetical protein